jgi:hypothetical protein
MRAAVRVTLGVAVACLIAGQALAQFPPITDPNRAEAKCQSGTATTLARLFGARMKCVRACIAAGRKAGGFGGCFGPGFTDPATNTCIFGPLNGTEAKAEAGISRACASDCPECYTAVDANLCATGQPFVTDVASQIDAFAQQIYCVEAGGAVPSESDAKCEDAVAKSLVRFVSAKTRCYQTCTTNMRRGSIAPGSCDPPLPADPATDACIGAAESGSHGAVYAIDKVCERIFDPAKNTRPACYTMVTGTGEGWVPLIESYVDSRISITACGG